MKIKNILLTILGFISLAVGLIGIAVPLLPTTPFVLLAALCFSLSNKKFYKWLSNSRVFGPYIENYLAGTGISIRRKIASIAFLWTGLAISMIVVNKPLVFVILAIVGIGVTIHLARIKTRKDGERAPVQTE